MRELPILFSAPMVRAILEGRKTVTRRPLRPQPFPDGYYQGDVCLDISGPFAQFSVEAIGGGAFCTEEHDCPYGAPGDRLWVREAWRVPDSLDACSGFDIAEKCIEAGYRRPWAPIRFEADGALNSAKDWREFGTTPGEATPGRYRNARFMPRWASRLTLELTAVRVERLQDIAIVDVHREGCHVRHWDGDGSRREGTDNLSETVFSKLWDGLAADGARWDDNPWVWVVEFKAVENAP